MNKYKNIAYIIFSLITGFSIMFLSVTTLLEGEPNTISTYYYSICMILLIPIVLIMYMKTKKKNYFHIFQFLNFSIISNVSAFIAMIVALIIGLITSDAMITFISYLLITEVIKIIFICILVIPYYYKDITRDFKKYFSKIENISESILYYFLSIVITAVLSTVMELIHSGDTATANQDSIETMMNSLKSFDGVEFMILGFTLFLSIVIIAPIFEEIIFRYILIGKVFKKKFGMIISVTLSAIIFALFHAMAATNFIDMFFDMIPYMGMSLILSYVYYKKENIGYTIVIHMLNNFIGFSVMIISIFS